MEQKFTEALREALEMEDAEISMDDLFRDYDNWDSLPGFRLLPSWMRSLKGLLRLVIYSKLLSQKLMVDYG